MNEELYPVLFNDRLWTKKECHSLFVMNYHSEFVLNDECGVYLSEGSYVYPDGTISH